MDAMVRTAVGRSEREARIDVLRGAALLMIFIDHIPFNGLAYFTLHNFALCDAAEVFVLLSGISAALAYGTAIDRDGWGSAIRRIARRCWQIYLAQVGLFLATLVIGRLWNSYFHLPTTIFAAVVQQPIKGVLLGFLLAVQPDYLNILPLYIIMLAFFPVIWLVVRRSIVLALVGSASLWLVSEWIPGINLPNWATHGGWYFDPLAWQFLMTIGVVFARLSARNGGNLPSHPVLAGAAAAFLLFTLPQTEAWQNLGLPVPWSFALDASDKTHLSWPRLLSVVALAYLVFASGRARALAGSSPLRSMQACGRHSLEVFVVGCVFALLGRLLFRVTDHGLATQMLVNGAGIAAMIGAAWWTDRRRRGGVPRPLAVAPAIPQGLARTYSPGPAGTNPAVGTAKTRAICGFGSVPNAEPCLGVIELNR
jgi:hypothetical protein